MLSSTVEPGADPWTTAPEKYRVLKEDGTLDRDATFAKVLAGHTAAEARIGAGDIRPKTADEYTITPPEAIKDAVKGDEPNLVAFKKVAHEAGFTQKQLDVAMGSYFENMAKLGAGIVGLDEKAARAELQQVWSTPESFKENATAAYRATQQFGGDLAEQLAEKYGNDPLFLQFAARIGVQLKEDTTTGLQSQTRGGESIDALMASEAYSNPRHADHASVTAKVSAWHAAQPGASAPL